MAGLAVAAGPWVQTEQAVLDDAQQSPTAPGKLHAGGSTQMLG